MWLAPGLALAQKPVVERPSYAVGDAWTLTDGTYRLVRVDRGVYVFTAGDDREIRLTRDLFPTFARRAGDTVEVHGAPPVAWPFEVGKRGFGRAMVRVSGTDIEVYATWRVEAAERVTLARGAFDALRVRSTFDPEIPGQFGALSPYQRFGPAARQAAFEVTWWYAPEVQRVVKAQSSRPALTFEVGGADVTALAPTAPPETSRPAPGRPETARSPVSGPTVALTGPVDQARLDRDTIALAGVVSSGRGVARVVVTLNGLEVARTEERAPRPAVSLGAPLRLREGANLLVVTATDGDGAIRQETRTVFYEKASPLTIAIRYPADGDRLADPQSVVAAVVTSSRGVASVSVTLNGTEVHRKAEAPPTTSVVVETSVTLREGANTLVVTARESGGGVRQEVRTVTLARAAAAPTAPEAAPAREQYAVVIGVGRYDNVGIPTLKYSVADAEAVYGVLVGTAGFKKDNVLLLTDRTDRKPTLRNVKYALGTFLARAAQKDDTVIVYFAGHGAPEIDPRGLERDGLAKYLIPSDADPEDLFSTALPMDDLQTIFGRIEAERVVVFLDSCYSGAAGGRTFASRKTRAATVDEVFLDRLTRSKGRAIITASRPSEVSIELPELGHGIFTYYLTEGLRGAGDLNRDGIVSLQELYEYLEHQVVRKSRAVGGNQHPVMKGELEGVLPLTKVRVR